MQNPEIKTTAKEPTPAPAKVAEPSEHKATAPEAPAAEPETKKV